jgi:hypothetical protein
MCCINSAARSLSSDPGRDNQKQAQQHQQRLIGATADTGCAVKWLEMCPETSNGGITVAVPAALLVQQLGYDQFDWELLFAATVMVTLPIIVIFFLAQKQFMLRIAQPD